VELGCQEAMNLDGGGSATLWYNGRVQNRPCDGYERPIANALVILKKTPAASDQEDKRATPAGN
jgi:exopolysaccharide biosynthesis protein